MFLEHVQHDQVICLSTNQKCIFTCTWNQRKSGHFQALDSIYSAYSNYPTDQKDIKVRSHWQWWCNSWRWPSCCSIGHKQAFLLEYSTQLNQGVNHLSSALTDAIYCISWACSVAQHSLRPMLSVTHVTSHYQLFIENDWLLVAADCWQCECIFRPF